MPREESVLLEGALARWAVSMRILESASRTRFTHRVHFCATPSLHIGTLRNHSL